MDKLYAVLVLIVVSAALVVCAVYVSLDSLRYKANAQFKRVRPQLVQWAQSVVSAFDGLDGCHVPGDGITVAEINRLCDRVNEKLAELARNGSDPRDLAVRFSDFCGTVFNEAFYYNEAVSAYQKKASAPLNRAVARLLRLKSPERISELFFQ